MERKNNKPNNLLCLLLVTVSFFISTIASASGSFAVTLTLGKVADYGASPWYTNKISFGSSTVEMIFDNGTNLFWATTDQCASTACNAHSKINTSQTGFSFVTNPSYPKTISFGAWGSMEAKLGSVGFSMLKSAGTVQMSVQFQAATNYSGPQFQYLSWGGGIGLPSESSSIEPNITDFFGEILSSQQLSLTAISFEMDDSKETGTVTFGAFGPNAKKDIEIILEPKKSPDKDNMYLWGSNLYSAHIGVVGFSNLINGRFYLDTGSSRFKGGREFIEPILSVMLTYKDNSGNNIFETYTDVPNTRFTGIKYANGKGPDDYVGILPEFSVYVGDVCQGSSSNTALIQLAPSQYSYKVEIGDRAGEWVLAFHVLDGIDGLLVGSTLMKYFSTTFIYDINGNEYSQGNMIMYPRTDIPPYGEVVCVSKDSLN